MISLFLTPTDPTQRCACQSSHQSHHQARRFDLKVLLTDRMQRVLNRCGSAAGPCDDDNCTYISTWGGGSVRSGQVRELSQKFLLRLLLLVRAHGFPFEWFPDKKYNFTASDSSWTVFSSCTFAARVCLAVSFISVSPWKSQRLNIRRATFSRACVFVHFSFISWTAALSYSINQPALPFAIQFFLYPLGKRPLYFLHFSRPARSQCNAYMQRTQ